MIIGKSLTALGGGGLKPEIIVTAKAGALLNMHYKDSSIILQSYQLGAEETQHTFVVSVSETAYVVEDATNIASVEVLADAVSQYSVQIQYVLWLYKDGDECEDVTGGYSYKKGSSNSEGGLLKNADNLTYYTNNGGNSFVLTANEIPFSDYSFLCGEIDISISGSTNAGFSFGSYTDQDGQITKTDMIYWNTLNSTSYSENDVRFKAEIKGSGGLCMYMNGAVTWNGVSRTCVIRKIWLE